MVDEKKLYQCRQCGHCCQGETTVSLDEKDFQRMRSYMNLSDNELIKQYLRVTDNVIQMQTVDGHCIFFNQGCTIHSAKPWRCNQWPLHPSILVDEANFEAIKTSCPGINQNLSYAEFRRLLAEYLEQK